MKLKTGARLSPFARFCRDSKGYDYYKSNGIKLDKWEVWEMGYKSANKIINGDTPVIAKPKPKETEDSQI